MELEKRPLLLMENGRPGSSRTWFTAKEAADYLGVTAATLYSYVKQRANRPPAFRLAGKPKGVLRFPKDEFIRWADGKPKQG